MSSQKPITLKEAIALLQSGAWINGLRFFTANVEKGTGGQVMELSKCRIARQRNTTTPKGQETVTWEDLPGNKKNPDHNYHFTRNIELPNRSIIKVHPILITHINQHPIL